MLGYRHLVTPLCLLSLAACETKAPPADSAPPPAASPEPVATPAATSTGTPPPAHSVMEPAPIPTPDPTPPKDAVRSKSGLAMVVLEKGKGTRKPKGKESVRVKALGFLPGGQRFGSPLPTVMSMADVAPGWGEALSQMVEGEKRRLWMSPALAFGNTPGAPMTAGGDIVLELELLAIPEPPPVPKDLKAPPKDALKTESGLVYKIMTKGTGAARPAATSQVSVHYSGWSQDGKLFDSSVMRGEATSFALNQVIKGWTEGVQPMGVGDKARFWIPGPLAYGDKPARQGVPAGLLVFDIELLAIR